MNLIKTGKVKQVYELDATSLMFLFTDNVSVFDKVVPSQIPRKGAVLCGIAAYWFKLLEQEGIKTHFIKTLAANKMQVRRARIISDYSLLDETTTNYLIPLEFICRHYVAGSLYDRLKSGRIDPERLGLSEVRYGAKLLEPYFETTTKLEPVDRLLTVDECLSMAGITMDEYERIRETVLSIDGLIAREVGRQGLIHVDGKKEFAFDEERELMVIDTFGTPDEDRFWDWAEFEHDRFVELSKEFVRRYYRDCGYHEQLMRSRESDKPEQPIPALPSAIVAQVSELYQSMYARHGTNDSAVGLGFVTISR